MEITARKVKELLEPIPGGKWIVNKYTNEKNSCCAIGHYERVTKNPNNYSFSNCESRGELRKYFAEEYHVDIASINNRSYARVSSKHIHHLDHDTPKERVISFLNECILKEEGYPDKTKELAKLPPEETVDVKIKEALKKSQQ